MRKIELLSPAKNAEIGIEAINHGADAVYIGAPQFSARAAAGSSIEDIERLVKHAHQYYAKVYVALNTILTDEELEQARTIIHQLYDIGTDALIIQDFGITQLDIPPIPLHASTQMDNRTVEKVRFLEQAGFEQVVLARELSIEQIREIAQSTNVQLEAFVHGALCVSYSGVCYMSQNGCGRSANRGNCAQFCRLPYSLTDATGKILAQDKYLLSLKDFNLSAHLAELIDAGVSSLKIEGRLKDISYVKNVTASYRQALDRILDGQTYKQASSGRCTYTFTPDTEKSFHRSSIDYFLHGRKREIIQMETPKSTGERIGTAFSRNGKIIVQTEKSLSNGDGFCFTERNGEFHGFRANTVEGKIITPSEKIFVPSNTILYRNLDQAFEKTLSKESAERKIATKVVIEERDNQLIATISDEDNISATIGYTATLEPCKSPDRQRENIIAIFKKSGNTIFRVDEVTIRCDIYFIPAGALTQWRRDLLEVLTAERLRQRHRSEIHFPKTDHPYIVQELDYRGNVHNQKAKEFFEQHHVKRIADSFEKKAVAGVPVMTCKHCLRYALGYCKLHDKAKDSIQEPLTLTANNGKAYTLSFDCKACEMTILAQ